MTDQISPPPPIPPSGGASNDWYYVASGARQGPTTGAAIKQLLNKKQIATDTQVWRKGMPEWKTLRESDLADLVAAEPPAISSQHIGNGYVWTLAFLPLVFAVIETTITVNNHSSKGLPLQLPFIINGLLGWLDDRRLKQAGYGSRLTRITAVLFQPVYLFIRAKLLKQRPYYAIAWILSMIVGFLIYAAVET